MRLAAGLPLLVALALFSAAVPASSGTVTHLTGTLSVRKADGSVRILSQKSKIENGDTISTERDSFAQIEFADGARLTLKPNTAVTIERFDYAEDRPQDDFFFYTLLRGGLRAVAGVVGERSSERYRLRTATADIGMRRPTAIAGLGADGAVRVGPGDARARDFGTLLVDDCASSRSGECARLEAAVFVAAADGEVVVRNPQGELGLTAGQSGVIALNQRPLFLSADPGLQFTPPATFIQSIMTGSVVNAGKSLECAVTR